MHNDVVRHRLPPRAGHSLYRDFRTMSLTSLDRECVISHSPVPVPRYDVPDHTIGTRGQAGHTYFKKCCIGRIHAPVLLVNHLAVGAVDHNCGKSRLQVAIEPDAHPVGRYCYGRAHSWIGMVRERMPAGRFRQAAQKHN